jgi:hypothetical protein
MNRAAIAILLVGLLAGCGSRTELKPLPGMSAVPKSAEAKAAETPAQLMKPSTQARPDRRADLLTESEERKDDPFDLPPGPDNGKQSK